MNTCYRGGALRWSHRRVISSFDDIYAQAVDRHGQAALEARFPSVKDADALAAAPDAEVLAATARRVFGASFG